MQLSCHIINNHSCCSSLMKPCPCFCNSCVFLIPLLFLYFLSVVQRIPALPVSHCVLVWSKGLAPYCRAPSMSFPITNAHVHTSTRSHIHICAHTHEHTNVPTHTRAEILQILQCPASGGPHPCFLETRDPASSKQMPTSKKQKSAT